MNKKLIIILLVILVILVSIDFGVKYYQSLDDKVDISITPAENNISQGHNLTVYVNSTNSLPFESYLIDATTYVAGAHVQYFGLNGSTPENVYGLIKFNITGNNRLAAKWNGTVMQMGTHRFDGEFKGLPFYTLAPAGYYKIDNIEYSVPDGAGGLCIQINYNHPVIHLTGIYYKIQQGNASVNISINHTAGYKTSLNSNISICSFYNNFNNSSYANFTLNQTDNYRTIHFTDFSNTTKTYGETYISMTTVNGVFYMRMYYGGEIE